MSKKLRQPERQRDRERKIVVERPRGKNKDTQRQKDRETERQEDRNAEREKDRVLEYKQRGGK